MTIPTTNPTTPKHAESGESNEQWISSLADMITVHAWHDPAVEANPLAVPTNSDEAMITGRVRIFVSCECLSGGAS